jgi:ribonucleoside-diphosphate reductase alpha subunit
MFVLKRNGKQEPMLFDKIRVRIRELSQSLEVDPALIIKDVISGLISGITTSEIDSLTCEAAYARSNHNPDYDTLAGRIYVSNLHKSTAGNYKELMGILQTNVTAENEPSPLLDPQMIPFAEKYAKEIDDTINYSRDYDLTYFSLKTLEKSYLLKNSKNKRIYERPQHMYMRMGLGLHYPREEEYKNYARKYSSVEELEKDALSRAFATYEALSLRKISHASPAMFNLGTKFPQGSSCFLFNVGDSLDQIYETLHRCAVASKFAGGLGVNISNVRCRFSHIKSTNGKSSGIIPMIQVFAKTAKYVNQGDKRNGALALYIEPWHADTLEFLELRLEDGASEETRATNIFLGLMIPDIFMKRVQENGTWSLMCPNVVKGLTTTYGEEFEKIYLEAEAAGKFVKQVPAQQIWRAIIKSQQQTGTPYILFKDHINRKNNQSNIGVIQGSNLCAEIVEYTDPDSVAVCNLASLSLPYYAKSQTVFDFEELGKMVELLIVNLNRLIDYGFLPTEVMKKTNLKQRAVAIGVSGLQEVLFIRKHAWEDSETATLNRQIFETMSYYADKKSAELGISEGSYEFFKGSPISEGKLQCDLWGAKPTTNYDWDGLRELCKRGMRNSLKIALMPTASTAHILGNTESFEPITSNLYVRNVLSGEFSVVNKFLVSDLKALGLWNSKMVDKIIQDNGSIQRVPEIPANVKRIYKTIWEIPQKLLVDLSVDRAPFVDQTQSLNIHFQSPTVERLSSLHMYSWSKGLKTGSYYIRSQAAVDPIKFTVQPEKKEANETKQPEIEIKKQSSAKNYKCTDEVCVSCST